ncbi:MAG: phosphoribosylaminoimidazolesuccinocarboxamide synthase, partial [Coprobacillus sp.]
MTKLLYEGKAKQVYETEKADEYMIHYKDDATAGNGVKHDQFEGKGVLNNTISC